MWCEKTDGLTKEEFLRGIESLESEMQNMAQKGEDSFPPTYAKFVGLCKEPEKIKNEGYYGGATNHFTPRGEHCLPEPKEMRDKRKAKGAARVDSLKSSLGLWD